MNKSYKTLSQGYFALFVLCFAPLSVFWLTTCAMMFITQFFLLSDGSLQHFFQILFLSLAWWGVSGYSLSAIAQVSISASFDFLNIRQVKLKHHLGIFAGSLMYIVGFLLISETPSVIFYTPILCVALLYILLMVNRRNYSGHYNGEYHLTRAEKKQNRSQS